MLLHDWIAGSQLQVVRGSPDLDVPHITDDSRSVQPNSAFIARTGVGSDGLSFLPDALARGASVVIANRAPDAEISRQLDSLNRPVAWVTSPHVDQALASRLAERFYGYPSRKLKLLGVTGTNGKTTTTFLIQHLLAQAGLPCGLIGTVLIDDGRARFPADQTTPSPIEFSRLLSLMVAHGCRAAVAEISSHALDQGRVAGLQFDVAVFTNLTGDHLDYHLTMQAYADAKARLFDQLTPTGWAVVNADDSYAAQVLKRFEPAYPNLGRGKVLACSVRGEDQTPSTFENNQAVADILQLGPDFCRVRMEGPWGSRVIRLPLVGRHNVYNALQAISAVSILADLSRLLPEAMENCPAPPGRLELVRLPDENLRRHTPVVLVDYAHTHDALENVLLALRPVFQGRLFVLFGCGGDRDRTKRPKMAAVACRLADRIIITSDNPRTEEPQDIINQILAGVPADARARVTVEPDRAAAIALAIASAAPADVVLLAGKGHEDYQIIGKTKRHFDDREHALTALNRSIQRQAPDPQLLNPNS
ncbi:MAG: UDP-N-acetylmuramoyl-L-alanyl-D-glutamate--2,6-diaminopimelate ligase [Phycisphaeraceae bacterium]|nr:UDP-N-acetylmuramoyl-L-alanyl-D-glutamate--2,6-diaminopimelate ligase [Phycisphaeraceae bacterium]